MLEKEKNTETKNNKKVLKIALVTLLIVVVIAGASVGGYFGYKHYSENKSTGTEWGDIYFDYIVNDEPNTEEYYKIGSLQDAKIGFIQTGEHSEPLMIVTGKKVENNFNFNCTVVYKIDENNNVIKPTGIATTANVNVEFLFDVQKKKYDYFINTSTGTSSTYTSVDTAIKDQKKYTEIQEKLTSGKSEITTDDSTAITKEYEEYKKNDLARTEYIVSKTEQTVTQNTLSGETISYNKQDEYIIDPEIEEKTFDYSKDMEKSDIRNAIETEVKDYKTIEETVTEDVKTAVEQKTQEVATKKQQIETAKAEIKADEERKVAEEEEKKAEEESNAGIKMGKYTLKFGKYKGAGSCNGETFTIKPNGTYEWNMKNGTIANGTWFKLTENSTSLSLDGDQWSMYVIADNVLQTLNRDGTYTWYSE